MAIKWITPSGSLGTIVERILIEIPLEATATSGVVSYSVIAGSLPRGLRLAGNTIKGSPVEVKTFTSSRFVVRATNSNDIEDRTFSISVDGSDAPEWLTREGFLNVGQGENYFVLDNSRVDFQLEATDTDLTAGDRLEFYLAPMGGQLPPGLSLGRDGRITGFTDPVFAIDYQNQTGAYDTVGFDIAPLDTYQANSNGYDSFFYDTFTFDYNEPNITPRRLSRAYSFIVWVSDENNDPVERLFSIWVVTEEFLKSDNSIVQVDTNLFRADNNPHRRPEWITESSLGRFRANNYVTIYLDVYDPPSLPGAIAYFLLPTNPDGSLSEIPPGLELDTITGELAGSVPYQPAVSSSYQFTMQAVSFPTELRDIKYTLTGNWNSTTTYRENQAVRYGGLIYIALYDNKSILPKDNTDYWELGVATSEKTFTVDIIGEIESAITWTSNSDVGSIKPNQASQLYVKAETTYYGGTVVYDFESGKLPPGLTLLGTGIIQGKVKQFADNNGKGLTRFFDSAAAEENRFNIIFDQKTTSFDQQFKFSVKARDTARFAESIKEFFIDVDASAQNTFSNLYAKAFSSKQKRLDWYNFITDFNIFRTAEIYRNGDPNFGVQTELKVLLYAGIESVNAVKYVQAMSRNHYRKQLRFGNVKSAVAKDLTTQEIVYEVLYVEIVDEYEKNGSTISNTIELKDKIESKVLVSYDKITIDSNIPFVSDSDHQRVFPNSIKNMRSRIKSVGNRDREFLPQWMRSIQPETSTEPGYVKALVLCYGLPGSSKGMVSRIKASNFDFKSIDFTVDRYVIDILDGEIEDKYLAFPHRDILNKLSKPSRDAVTVKPTVVEPPVVIGLFDNTLVTFDSDTLTFDNGVTLTNVISTFDNGLGSFDSNTLTFDQG